MKIELQNKLYDKYPKIFKQKDLDIQQTAMCWGIDTGNGWYWLLDQLCDSIQRYIDCNKHRDIEQVEATQVKEKFGGLCFYYQGGDDLIMGMVDFAESMSYGICESCGTTKNVRHTEGWVQSICERCEKK